MTINYYNYFFNHAICGDDHSCLSHLHSPEILLKQKSLLHQHGNTGQQRSGLNDKMLATYLLLRSFNSVRMIAGFHTKKAAYLSIPVTGVRKAFRC